MHVDRQRRESIARITTPPTCPCLLAQLAFTSAVGSLKAPERLGLTSVIMPLSPEEVFEIEKYGEWK
jgi:hypothetical protein